MINPEQWRGGRRDFLAGAARLAGSAVVILATPVGYDFLRIPNPPNPNIPAPKEESLEEIVSQIRAFEAEVGNQALTFEQARTYVPVLGKQFVKATGSPTSAEEFSNSTYVIRRRYDTPEEEVEEFKAALIDKRKPPHEVSVVKYLIEDYPCLALSNKQAQGLVSNLRGSTFFDIPTAWVAEDKVFLVLERLNNTPSSYKIGFEQGSGSLGEVELPAWQYQGFGAQVECRPPTPVTKFRSAFHHEVVHRDNHTEGLPLEKEVIEAYNRARASMRMLGSRAFTTGEKSHFSTKFSYEELVSGEPEESFLNEFVADYIQATINAQSGLPYIVVYGEPYDFGNFGVVLHQSGISNPELYEHYRNSKVKELLLRIAQGAKNFSFTDEVDMLEFGANRLLLNRTMGGGINFRPILWTDFAPHFDGIDLRIYQHVDPYRLNFPMFYSHRDAVPYHVANATLSCVQ